MKRFILILVAVGLDVKTVYSQIESLNAIIGFDYD